MLFVKYVQTSRDHNTKRAKLSIDVCAIFVATKFMVLLHYAIFLATLRCNAVALQVAEGITNQISKANSVANDQSEPITADLADIVNEQERVASG